MSAACETLPIDEGKVADSTKNLPIEGDKAAGAVETANNHSNSMPAKMPIETFQKSYMEYSYNEPTILNLQHIYEAIDVNQIFGNAYLVKILGCSERTARNLIAKLREMEAVVPVMGKGKGVYRFKNKDE